MERAKAQFAHLGFKVVTCTRYLGGHIGDEAACAQWIEAKVVGWVAGVKALAKVAQSSLQCAFAGIQKSLQSEWMHLQRSIGSIGAAFEPVEEAIEQHFLPALLGTCPNKGTPPALRTLLSLPVKFAGVGVPNPTTTSDIHHTTSTACTAVLTDSLLGNRKFNTRSHTSTMQGGRRTAKDTSGERSLLTLTPLLQVMRPLHRRKTKRARDTGA